MGPDYELSYIQQDSDSQQITKCQVRWTTDIAYVCEFSVKAYGDYRERRERGQVLSYGNTIRRPIITACYSQSDTSMTVHIGRFE